MPRITLATRSYLPFCVALTLGASCVHHRRDTEPVSSPIVTSEDIDRSPGTPIERIIEAKIPGIQVSRTSSGGVTIRIHGTSSFYGNNEPLYVIDGTPIEAAAGGALNSVNPYDIESIRVLKDPAETGIYGIRGANGVIVITTKRPGGGKSPST